MRNVLGRWRITGMEEWDPKYVDELGPGFLKLDKAGMGSLQFGVVQAEVDYRMKEREGSPLLAFSFEGFSEMDHVSGRGWADVDGRTMNGHIYFHFGDDSAFVARRSGSIQRG